MGERRESFVEKYVLRTHGQRQRGIGLRVGGSGVWGGGKWWWENGDNCTCTTIKKKRKQGKILNSSK